MLGNKNPTPVALDAQVIINCGAGGGCDGGNPAGVYEYAFKQGIPDSSCEQYVAKDPFPLPIPGFCDDIVQCKDCTWPPCPANETCQDKCWAVDYKPYYAKNYFSVQGADQMKAELAKNGPIACGIEVTPKFENYTTGIYSEFKDWISINHEISVVGYGVDS